MYWLIKLAKYKVALTLVAVLALGMMIAPVAMMEDVEPADPFGINPIEDPNTGIALGTNSLQTTVASIINVALSLLGIVAVVIILLGGFKWMTAGGNDEKTGEARKLIFSGIIGLAIILSAWAIAKFVLVQLGQATGVTGATDYTIN